MLQPEKHTGNMGLGYLLFHGTIHNLIYSKVGT